MVARFPSPRVCVPPPNNSSHASHPLRGGASTPTHVCRRTWQNSRHVPHNNQESAPATACAPRDESHINNVMCPPARLHYYRTTTASRRSSARARARVPRLAGGERRATSSHVRSPPPPAPSPPSSRTASRSAHLPSSQLSNKVTPHQVCVGSRGGASITYPPSVGTLPWTSQVPA